jgi:hypothetical protein
MKALNSFAVNCGPLSEMILGSAPGNFSRAAWMMIWASRSVIDGRISQWTMYREYRSTTRKR